VKLNRSGPPTSIEELQGIAILLVLAMRDEMLYGDRVRVRKTLN